MRHRKAGRKFGRNPSQRKAMLRQLAISLILNERIVTTEAKAKELRSVVEKLITIARDDSAHTRNIVTSRLDHEGTVNRLFTQVAPRFADQNGGYTRMAKIGLRKGDAAPMVLIEFVD
jgi:large subunit ribosomal protein L17